MDSIYLIGFMGAGKTTIGKELGRYLQLPVFDTDEEIVKSEKRSINLIFEQDGEMFFREQETNTLRQLLHERAVITTGGGIITRKENCQLLKENGLVFFLFATPEEIMKRLEQDKSRPLLKGDKKQKITELYEERMSLYKDTADFVIDTTGKKVDEIVKEIVLCLKPS